MNIFKWIAKQFETVYCEECDHCIPPPSDGIDRIFSNDQGKRCTAYPVEVDTSGKEDYMKRDREKSSIKAFTPCREVRMIKSMPLVYRDTCSKFKKKSLTNEGESL